MKNRISPIVEEYKSHLVKFYELKIQLFALEHKDFWRIYDMGWLKFFVKHTGDLPSAYRLAKQMKKYPYS